jgi:RNA polymerase sigma-70 factor (ECF subfamily)
MKDTVERAKLGDRAAVEELLGNIAPSVHRFGLRLCGNAHDADDVLQDTLLSVSEHLSDFEGRASFASWVFALTRSACARRRRGLKNQPTESVDDAPEQRDAAPTPEAQAADRELLNALLRALDALPVAAREVLVLRDIEGLSAAETAAALGLSLDTMKSRLHRARAALREGLRPVLEPEPLAGTGCPDIVALWSRKLDGELSRVDCAAMEAHLETCAACGAACHALKQALGACQHAATTAVPPVVQTRVKEAVRAWATRSSAGQP